MPTFFKPGLPCSISMTTEYHSSRGRNSVEDFFRRTIYVSTIFISTHQGQIAIVLDFLSTIISVYILIVYSIFECTFYVSWIYKYQYTTLASITWPKELWQYGYIRVNITVIVWNWSSLLKLLWIELCCTCMYIHLSWFEYYESVL